MNSAPDIKLIRTENADPALPFPQYETSGAAGADLRANFAPNQRAGVTLSFGERILIPTGLIMDIPVGWEVQVRPRSGLALKHGVTLVNSPGTIDCDYRGEIGVIIINLGQEDFHIAHGDRIAQIVVAPAIQATFTAAATYSETKRGTGGFGSTGAV